MTLSFNSLLEDWSGRVPDCQGKRNEWELGKKRPGVRTTLRVSLAVERGKMSQFVERDVGSYF